MAKCLGCSSMLFSVVLLACSCSGKALIPPGSTANATEFCASFEQATVNLLTRCYGGGETFWADIYEDLVNCPEVTRLVSAGALVYDASQGKQCLDDLRALPCDNTGAIASCNAALIGMVPAGGACAGKTQFMFPECAQGNECWSQRNACGGTCRAHARIGQACGNGFGTAYIDCEDGATCGWDTKVCIVEATEGQPCAGSDGVSCAAGLYCDGGNYPTTGTCRKQKTSGTCANDGECATSYACVPIGGPGTCRKEKLPGESCEPGECVSLFSWCGTDGKCTNVGSAENQPCGSTGGEYIQCAKGLYCDYSVTSANLGTCRREIPAGASCTSGGQCANRGYCDELTGRCVSCK